jgi:hypothetical protein
MPWKTETEMFFLGHRLWSREIIQIARVKNYMIVFGFALQTRTEQIRSLSFAKGIRSL